MLLHDLKNALRFIKRDSSFSAINIIGLTIGIFCCLLIILYILSELTFDRFHSNGNNIYRVVMHQPGNQVVGSSSEWWVVSPAILKPEWESELPEVDLITRTQSRSWTFQYNGQLMDEEILIVDPEFFDIFTFPLKKGNPKQALSDLYSIVISNEMANKYFGMKDPIGKTIVLNDGRQLIITGILKEIPINSHLQFDFLVSFKTLEAILGKSLLSDNWLNNSYRTYLTLNENTDLNQLDAKLRKYNIEGFNGNTWTFHLQPLYDIHFNNQMLYGTGDRGTFFIFITVGLFILFIACFNYLNLYISHYRTRIRYISIRKIVGASRSLLVRQFFSESILLVFISYLVSIAMVWLILPLFNSFFEPGLSFKSIWRYQVLLASLGLIFIMAFIASVYPAIYLTRLPLLYAIKGGMLNLSKESQYFRKVIVTLQFSASIALITGTVTIFKQLKYVSNKNLGYEKENILCLNLLRLYYAEDFNLRKEMKPLKQELLRNPDILGVAASTGIPCEIGWSNIPTWEGKAEDENPFFYRMIVDFDFLDLYGIQLADGRNFSRDMATDDGNAYIINRAAAERLGFRSPVNSKFGFDDKLGTIVGLSEDFYFESLHKPITPLGIGVNDEYYWQYISIKTTNTNFQKTLEYIEGIWKKFVPAYPMDCFFIDDRLEQIYGKDRQLSKSMNYLSLMALFISCLGIFGLMSFTLKERTKEIGIRKVMGASFSGLLVLLAREMFPIVCFAGIAGGVLGWYFSTEWLNNFAYHFNLRIDIIIISFILVLFLAVISISFNIIRSIRTNPVESLRNE